ncbi:hypothetical protein ACIBK8_28605 [Streptomyces sp. NPDC050161]|uniref:hypothetical protein n=1 Tax=Streptomyces sp. NPDC050161 TaxID=3365604 RepID=UPI00378E07CA
MSTITTPVIPASRTTTPTPARKTAPYEDWRPPITGVSLLIPVGVDALAVVDFLGSIMMPTGTVHTGQTPEQAAQDVLHGAPDGLPLLRRVVLTRSQTRRRKVITHVLATTPMTRADVGHLKYRDPRADVRVLPTMRIINGLPTPARLLALVGLQALATGETAYLEGGLVRPYPPERVRQ